MIKRFGGLPGIRDLGLIESAVGKPQATFDGNDLYNTIFNKAAALLQSLLKNHPFVDGNKRTALTSAGIFLKLNGYQLINDHDNEVSFTLKVDNEHLTIEQIVKWLEKHSKTIL
jgi:death-on-curing protein